MTLGFGKSSGIRFTFPMSEKQRRGSYAKGIAKREEILTRALEVIAREGYAGASVKAIADAVGLSQAGLLHYFDSKEELFTEILRKRDERDLGRFGPALHSTEFVELRSGFTEVIRHNSEVPGLVHLFARLSVDAADPEHPAHEYFLQRGVEMRENFAETLGRAQQAGQLGDRIDPQTLARLLQAVADGMQLQWMIEPEVDMSAVISALFTLAAAADPAQRNAATDA